MRSPSPQPRPPAPGRYRLIGSILLGAAVGSAVFGVLAIARAVPRESTPRSGTVWTLIAVALLAVGAALWLLPKGRAPRPRVAGAWAIGLVLALLATLATSPALWRSIAGHPDNSPRDFYQPSVVGQLIDRLVSYADNRAILGIYLSNHYESSVIVPLSTGPAGSAGGEIVSVLPDGSTQVVQTKLSPGIASAEGIEPTQIDPRVVSGIVSDVSAHQSLSDRDEVRVQVQRRDGVTAYEVLTRKGGVDQPWQRFGLDGARIDR